jgi:hypothetical protein
MIGTQHFPGLWVDPVRQHTRRADHTLVRSICFVAGRIVSNPAFNNQARTGAAEVKCRHAETLRASSDRRFDLTQIKAASLRRTVARRIGGNKALASRKPLHPSPQGQYDENADGDVIGNEHGVPSHPD